MICLITRTTQPQLMAARAYLLERRPKQPLVFAPADTPVSEVVGRMNRLLHGTGLEVGVGTVFVACSFRCVCDDV